MRALPGLIRLHRLRLDEQRRRLVRLETTQAQLAGHIQHLDAQVAAEGRAAGDAAETGIALGSYVQATLGRRRQLEQAEADVELQIGEVREEVAEAFRELKRFELAEVQQRRRAAVKQRQRDRAREDDIGIDIYRRRESQKAE